MRLSSLIGGLLGAIAVVLSTGGVALAQTSDWRECAGQARSGGPNILPPWCTVVIEHEDRKARLRRLSRARDLSVAPTFYEYVIPWRELSGLLPDFPADVSILRVVFPERVLFDVDKAELRPEALEVLDVVADALRREPPDVALFVAGHTDATASDAYNFNLSLRRADSVALALKARGVGLSSIFRTGFGEAVPVAANATEEGRQLNRRVEFIFAAKPEAAAAWLARQAAETCYAADPAALAKCRKTVVVAREVTIVDLPRRPPPQTAPSPSTGRPGSASMSRPHIEIAAPPRRSYTIDLGRRSVAIDLPKR